MYHIFTNIGGTLDTFIIEHHAPPHSCFSLAMPISLHMNTSSLWAISFFFQMQCHSLLSRSLVSLVDKNYKGVPQSESNMYTNWGVALMWSEMPHHSISFPQILVCLYCIKWKHHHSHLVSTPFLCDQC